MEHRGYKRHNGSKRIEVNLVRSIFEPDNLELTFLRRGMSPPFFVVSYIAPKRKKSRECTCILKITRISMCTEVHPMNNGIVTSPEWHMLKMREEYLRSKCADVVEVYMHTVSIVGPSLKSLYMVNIGQFESRLFQLKIEIRRWRRRFELRRQALNRGEKPDYIAIEDSLKREFEDYVRQIRERHEALKNAAFNMMQERLSDEETTAIRMEYLNAVKKLHPDINPSLPEVAKELWNKIQRAYDDKNWAELKVLSAMVDDVLEGVQTCTCGDSIDELRLEVARLEDRLKELSLCLNALWGEEPYVWKDLFENDDEIRARQNALKKLIESAEETISLYERKWKEEH